MAALQTVVIGVLLLTALVVIHEFGHYAAARAFGVRVSEFMVGLPGPHIKLFKRGGTTFGITAYLLGGYARIAGMDPTPEDPLLGAALGYVYREGVADAEHLAWYLTTRGLVPMPRSAEEREKLLERADDMLIALEGWASVERDESKVAKEAEAAAKGEGKVFWPRLCAPEDKKAGYVSGQPRPVADEAALLESQRKGTYNAISVPKRLAILFAGPFMNLLTALVVLMLVLCVNGVFVVSSTLEDVVEGGAAQMAGIAAGDQLTNVDGVVIESWDDLGSALSGHEPGDVVEVSWLHEGVEHTAELALQGEPGAPMLGVYGGYERYRLSIGEGLQTSFAYMGQVLVAIANLFNPFQVREVLSDSASVVGIAVMAKQAADTGIASFAMIVVAVSVSLGFMNLLPIPPLDGGKIVIELVQAVRGRQVSVRVQNYITIAGLILFGALFIFTLSQDIGRLMTGFW